MHFHVARRESPLTLASQQVCHVLITLIRALNFSVFKSYSVLMVLLLQLLSC